MDGIGQLTLRPAPSIDTPRCLTKGGETNPRYRANLSIDYLRATFKAADATGMRHVYGGEEAPLRGNPQGYRNAVKYSSGWVRQFNPIAPDRTGLMNYETWEKPGQVQHDELAFITKNFPAANLTQCHITADFIDQDYPRPWELRKILSRCRPRTKNPSGRRFEGDDGSQTWYLGKRSSTVHIRVYEKGKQLISEGASPDTTTDWVRVEAELHAPWLLKHAWELLTKGDITTLAVDVFSYYFQDDAGAYLPRADHCTLEPPQSSYDATFMTIYHMLKQYGPLMQVLDEADLLGPLLSVPKPSRTSKWRNAKILDLVNAEGHDSIVKGMAKMFGHKDNQATKGGVF